MPSDLKHEIEAESRRTGSSSNDVIVRALADALAVSLPSSRKDPMATTNGTTNGRGRRDEKVRVALIGVGNCANSLVQGVQFYKDADPEEFVPGLMHVDLGGYHVRDVEFTAAFDVTADKVGKDLSEVQPLFTSGSWPVTITVQGA